MLETFKKYLNPFSRKSQVPSVVIPAPTAEKEDWEKFPVGYVSPLTRLKEAKDVEKAAQQLYEAMPWLGNSIAAATNYQYSFSPRDLSYATWLKVLNKAEWMARQHPLASRALDIKTSLVVSEGLYPKATCPDKDGKPNPDADKLQKFLDEHWELNDWHTHMFKRVRDLAVVGEMYRMVPEIITNPTNSIYSKIGTFELYDILPHEISHVFRHPYDVGRLMEVEFINKKDYEDPALTRRWPIAFQERRGSEAGQWFGNIIHCHINSFTGATRGLSDLLPVLEWLDIHDQLLWNEAERTAQMLKFCFDVTLTGANADDIFAKVANLKGTGGPSRGSINVHNENEIWKVVQPDLASTESDVVVNRLFLHCWGGLGLPEHWYAQANTVNKSSGDEMSIPVWSWVRSRKLQVTEFQMKELRYAIYIAKRNGYLDKGLDENFVIQSRDPDRTSYDQLGDSLDKLTRALSSATSGGYLGLEAAQLIFVHVANAWGLDIPIEAAGKINLDPNKAKDIATNQSKDQLKKDKLDAQGKAKDFENTLKSELSKPRDGQS